MIPQQWISLVEKTELLDWNILFAQVPGNFWLKRKGMPRVPEQWGDLNFNQSATENCEIHDLAITPHLPQE